MKGGEKRKLSYVNVGQDRVNDEHSRNHTVHSVVGGGRHTGAGVAVCLESQGWWGC